MILKGELIGNIKRKGKADGKKTKIIANGIAG